MKTVCLVRHAEAESPMMRGQDFQRHLTERGESQAIQLAGLLKEKSFTPDYVLVSEAKRAISTSEILKNELGWETLHFNSQLYSAHETTLLEILQHEIDAAAERVCVIGHNPTLSYFAAKYAKDFSFSLPTASAVSMTFAHDAWEDLGTKLGRVDFLVFP